MVQPRPPGPRASGLLVGILALSLGLLLGLPAAILLPLRAPFALGLYGAMLCPSGSALRGELLPAPDGGTRRRLLTRCVDDRGTRLPQGGSAPLVILLSVLVPVTVVAYRGLSRRANA